MGRVIAVSGKGGAGKTLLAALLVRKLVKTGHKSILAIDADPDSNLPDALGVFVESTIGDIREEFSVEQSRLPPGYSKDAWLESKVFEIMVETPSFDVLVMGRPEGPGCYCAVNHILRKIIDSMTGGYDYAIIDAEAGLEHLSRRTTQNVDDMIVVTNGSLSGFNTAERIKNLANELRIKFKHLYLVVNRANSSHEKLILKRVGSIGLEFAGGIPEDANVAEYNLLGKSLLELPDDSPAVKAMDEIMEKLSMQGGK
ncbi:MAG: AAA family ATPase [Methanocellales archaeon]|nr:AAA family ATPase [Methanocellales archaeon]